MAADHFGLAGGQAQGEVAVARAIAELRDGRPVRLAAGALPGAARLVIGAEAFDGRLATAFAAVGHEPRLVLPGPRLKKLGWPAPAPARWRCPAPMPSGSACSLSMWRRSCRARRW